LARIGDEGKAVGSIPPAALLSGMIRGVGVPYNLRSHFMRSYQNEFAEASRTAQKKIAETEKSIGDATRQAQDEFARTSKK
jgi:hypothetical protein